nr:hypothetical protein [Tanacetum cinerariifolium]
MELSYFYKDIFGDNDWSRNFPVRKFESHQSGNKLRSTNESNNGLRIWLRSFNLDDRRLDVFDAFIVSRRHLPLQLMIPFKSSFGLVTVLLGRVPEPEDEASQLVVKESRPDEPELGNLGLDKLEILVLILEILILIVLVFILIKSWWSEIIFQTIAKQITITLRTFIRFLLIYAISAFSATISGWKEEVTELHDSLRWDEDIDQLKSYNVPMLRIRLIETLTEVGDFISELRHHGRWKIFSKKHFGHLIKCIDRIPWQTIKPSGGMMCQG